MIAVLEMHAQITVGWELGSEQMKENWSRCDWSLTDAIPSWEWHNTWYCFALWEAMFANSTSIPLSISVIVCWFCYGEIPMKVKKGCASSISQEREAWRVLNQPLCPVMSCKQFRRKLRQISPKGAFMQPKLAAVVRLQWCCCLAWKGRGEFYILSDTHMVLQL